MRLGRRLKPSKTWKKAGSKEQKPKNISRDSQIGRTNPDIINSHYAPIFLDNAAETLERYADEIMQYEELLAALENNATVQVETNGETTPFDDVVAPEPPLFSSQYRIDEFAQMLSDTSDHFFAKSGGWRVQANAAKFERMLDERYGILRPFILKHPEIENLLRSMERKYAAGQFSPIRKPPLPRTTSVIILFLMYRGKVQWEILTLATLFLLVGLQPWALVLVVALLRLVYMNRKSRRVGLMPRKVKPVKSYYHRQSKEVSKDDKYKLLNNPVGAPLQEGEPIDTNIYDTIILGSGSSTLFAAALLSRAGRRVLVLCPDRDASNCFKLENPEDSRFEDVPFDLGTSNMSKISRQQKLLAPCLSTESDCQGGIRFAKIGSDADGHAFEILSIPGVGGDRADQQIPFVLKGDGGVDSFMSDTAMLLGDGWPGNDGSIGRSNAGAYVRACEQMNSSAGEFYLGKILSESTEKYRSASIYQNASSRYSESIINQYFPTNPHVRSLLAAIGLKSETLRPCKSSMAAHITHVCAALSGEGMHYPVGGPRALCHALAGVIEQLGGRIVTEAPIRELIFTENEAADIATTEAASTADTSKESQLPPPTCVGVQLVSGDEIRFDHSRFSGSDSASEPAILSMLPFINTFIRVFPNEIRTKYGCPRGLPALAEQRPVFHFVFALHGNARELDLTGADFYRVPSAARAHDEVDGETHMVKHGEMGYVDPDEATATVGGDESSLESNTMDSQKRKNGHQKRFEKGVSWIQVSFPSAKDPSFESRYGSVSTCVVTVEADDDFVVDMGSKPRIFQAKRMSAGVVDDLKKLQERVQGDLLELFPQLEGKIKQVQVVGPRSRGMSHTPERFVAKGVRAAQPYNRLFYGGSDLTIGENFSASVVAAWLASNLIAGYTTIDHLFLQKNLTSDLGQILDDPGADDEDVAVPYEYLSEPQE